METLPKYLQLSRTLEERIVSGVWGRGKTPTVRGIAEEHKVSIVTASRALQVLRDKGLITTVERSGCFVLGPDERSRENWALCLRITPGPFQQASAAITESGFEALARRTGAVFESQAFDLQPDITDETIRQQVAAARDEGIGGVFLLPWRRDEQGMNLDERFLAACRAQKLPVVLLERNLRGRFRSLDCDLVTTDDVSGGRLTTRHLIEQGRQRIAFIIGSPCSSHEDRLAGYLHEMYRNKLEPIVLEQSDTPALRDAYAALAGDLLERKADGVVCYQDYTAMGVIMELLRRGKTVPNDLAVVGFDDLPVGSVFAVGVTTYAFPSEKVAEQALLRMRQRQERPDDPPIHIIVPGHLVIRDSSGAGVRSQA